MFHKLFVMLGFCFPSVSDVVRGRRDCVRTGSRSYFVRNKGAFAEAFSHYTDLYRGSAADCLANDPSLYVSFLEKATELTYPCVVFFNADSFESISVDEPTVEYPTL